MPTRTLIAEDARRTMHGPAWRSLAAQQTAGTNRRKLHRASDVLLGSAARYFALRSRDVSARPRAAKFPEIEAAVELQRDAAQTDVAKLLVLVGAPTAQIAGRLGVSAEVVDIWERLFFDVRPLRTAATWLASRVINAEQKAGNGALAARMKLAIVAGAEAVDAMLAMDKEPPLGEADRLFRRTLRLNLKFDQALEAPIDNDANRIKFMRLYADMRAQNQRLAQAGQRLAARCVDDRNRFELAKQRMEFMQKRCEQQARAAEERRHERETAQELATKNRRNRVAAKAAAQMAKLSKAHPTSKSLPTSLTSSSPSKVAKARARARGSASAAEAARTPATGNPGQHVELSSPSGGTTLETLTLTGKA